MRVLLLGPPGSGKGTLGRRLAQEYGVPHIAAGDMIREQIAQGTAFGQKVATRIAQGQFAPDADMIAWIAERLACSDARDGYVLDGFPRDLAQAREFDKNGVGRLDATLELTLTEAALRERLRGRWVCPSCERTYHEKFAPPAVTGVCDADGSHLLRRADDAANAVRTRLLIYEEVTLPLRSYYGAQGLLRTLDATVGIEEVYRMARWEVASGSRGYNNARLEV